MLLRRTVNWRSRCLLGHWQSQRQSLRRCLHAIGQWRMGSEEVLEELATGEFSLPAMLPRDVTVEIKAVSVNPVDCKIRTGDSGPNRQGQDEAERTLSEPLVLGYDATGVVVDVGEDTQLFSKGDEVFFAGVTNRPGTNAELCVVDERIVGHKPRSLTWGEAASLPLTALTAWEALFEMAGMNTAPTERQPAGAVLVHPGAGGVGSLAIQIVSRVLGQDVVATASRPETVAHCRHLGAVRVVNHHESLLEQLQDEWRNRFACILTMVPMDQTRVNEFAELLAPQGRIVSIVPPPTPLDFAPLFPKRNSLAFELMFSRALWDDNPVEQYNILHSVSRLVDRGALHPCVMRELPFNLENLREAHRMIDSGTVIGKVVLTR